ncbi:unnamed protein product [Caenorhabditis auriculariae]|uniref:Uncharacterized protein n=1 Tax=Caenorhabditis auriculariae TaxID=2777116 RepID=A0A8S1H7R6_9PELO|nr:unnamed protein product [Caenorhabditis auriculariae]
MARSVDFKRLFYEHGMCESVAIIEIPFNHYVAFAAWMFFNISDRGEYWFEDVRIPRDEPIEGYIETAGAVLQMCAATAIPLLAYIVHLQYAMLRTVTYPSMKEPIWLYSIKKEYFWSTSAYYWKSLLISQFLYITIFGTLSIYSARCMWKAFSFGGISQLSKKTRKSHLKIFMALSIQTMIPYAIIIVPYFHTFLLRAGAVKPRKFFCYISGFCLDIIGTFS